MNITEPGGVRARVNYADVREWCAYEHVPQENLLYHEQRDYARGGLLRSMSMFMAQKQVSVAHKDDGELPSTLWDWLKLYLLRALPLLSRWLTVRTTRLVRREETRLCPHLSVGERGHLEWMTYGDEFEHTKEVRAAAYGVLNAALSADYDEQDIFGVVLPIRRAVILYEKAARG